MKALYFHEAEVVTISASGDHFVLELSGVSKGSGFVSVRFDVDRVTAISVDGNPVKILPHEPGNGDILTLSFTPDRLDFIVNWETYAPLVCVTRSYSVAGNVSLNEDR